MSNLERRFGIANDQQPDTSALDTRPPNPSDPAQNVRSALGGKPIFTVDENGKPVKIFSPNSALMQTVRETSEDTNKRRIEIASEILGFEYIP